MFKVGDVVRFRDLTYSQVSDGLFGIEFPFAPDNDVVESMGKARIRVEKVSEFDDTVKLEGLMYCVPEYLLEYADYRVGDIVECYKIATPNPFEGTKRVSHVLKDLFGSAVYQVEGDDWFYTAVSLKLVKEADENAVVKGDIVTVRGDVTILEFVEALFGKMDSLEQGRAYFVKHAYLFMSDELIVDSVDDMGDDIWVTVVGDELHLPLSILEKV